MTDLFLKRHLRDASCTMGRLTLANVSWHTIERPWVNGPGPGGMKGTSCVPAGRYRLEPHSSDAHPRTFALVAPSLGVYHWPWEVPKSVSPELVRTVCLIHAANWAAELRGCIAPGKDAKRDPRGTWMVLRSRDAMNELTQSLLGKLELYLTISEEFG